VNLSLHRPDGAQLSYHVRGSGPDLMLISGLSGTAAFWDPVVEALGAGRRIITLDQRGIAASSRGTQPVTIDTLAEDCLAILDSVGSETAVLVGHSTGGVIAQSMALSAPGRITGLALTATWARADRYMRELMRSRLELLRSMPKEYAASMLFIGYPADWLRENWQALDAALAAAPLTLSQQDVIAERIAALLAFDRLRDMPVLRPPAIVIGAEDDQVVPPYLQRELAAALPGARMAMLARGGHFFPISRLEEFMGILKTWLTATVV
jgi:aminoacrylate hydrolase